MTELNPKLLHNKEVEYVIDYFAHKSKSSIEDIVSAYNLFTDMTFTPEVFEKYLHLSYVMCKYMTPSLEDVISLLLWYSYYEGRCGFRHFRETFRSDRFEHYFNQTKDVVKNTPKNTSLKGDDAKNYYAFMRVCDKMFDSLSSSMEKKCIPDNYSIWKAYKIAREAHYGVYRVTGEPYLTHPIAVATILANLGVESHIVAAALLHDVIEDADSTLFTLKDISDECGEQTARYVDAVTSLHRQYANSHIPSEYSQDKNELDARSYEKLVCAVRSDPKMVFALYIKAADRIHNLSTIDVMTSEKQYDKIDETELDYLPLFREFKLNYFVEWIEDLTRKVANPEEYKQYESGYKNMYSKNLRHIKDMEKTLNKHLGEDFNDFCLKLCDTTGYDFNISKRLYRPIEVYKYIRESVGPAAISPKMIDKRTVPICDFDIILDGRDAKSTIDTFANLFVKMYVENIAPSGREITDFEMDGYERFIVKIEDRYRNVFRLCFCMRESYNSFNFGSQKGIIRDRDEVFEQPKGSTIFVKLRNGRLKEIPQESTVLDLAFRIHEEVGLCATGALINGRQARISSILHDGDKVEIKTDTERVDGRMTKFTPHARIFWLTFVKTKDAKHKITRYLEGQYEGDSSVTPLQNEVLDYSQNRIWEADGDSVNFYFSEEE